MAKDSLLTEQHCLIYQRCLLLDKCINSNRLTAMHTAFAVSLLHVECRHVATFTHCYPSKHLCWIRFCRPLGRAWILNLVAWLLNEQIGSEEELEWWTLNDKCCSFFEATSVCACCVCICDQSWSFCWSIWYWSLLFCVYSQCCVCVDAIHVHIACRYCRISCKWPIWIPKQLSRCWRAELHMVFEWNAKSHMLCQPRI